MTNQPNQQQVPRRDNGNTPSDTRVAEIAQNGLNGRQPYGMVNPDDFANEVRRLDLEETPKGLTPIRKEKR